MFAEAAVEKKKEQQKDERECVCWVRRCIAKAAGTGHYIFERKNAQQISLVLLGRESFFLDVACAWFGASIDVESLSCCA